MRVKEVYFAPTPLTKQLDCDKAHSGYSTKHSSGDKVNTTDESDAYQLRNAHESQFKRHSKKQHDETLTNESEEHKQPVLKSQMTFKQYRKMMQQEKSKRKKSIKERQKEIIKRKNSSNGSIKAESESEVADQTVERSRKTQSLINRIAEANSKKARGKSEPVRLDVNNTKAQKSEAQASPKKANINEGINQDQIEVNFKPLSPKPSSPLKSPKPPKPTSKKNTNESVGSVSNSVNISQLLRDVAPTENVQKKRRIVLKTKPKIDLGNFDFNEDSKKAPAKIDIGKISLKKSGKAPVIMLKKAQIARK